MVRSLAPSQNEHAVVRLPARLGLSHNLRTDSVNRGFCISFLTLAIVALADSLKFLILFIIPQY
jgi:hypothetical protein